MASTELIPFAFYRRLSPREQSLSLAVTGAVFILINLFALNLLTGGFGDLRKQCAEQSTNLQVQRLFASDQPKVAQRMSWLHSKQPVLGSRDRAGTGLLEQVLQFARGSKVIMTSQKIIPQATAAAEGSAEGRLESKDYQAVTVELETQSDWAGVQKFIQALQQPESFLVFDLASLRSGTDPAVILGHFRISKWYAPAH